MSPWVALCPFLAPLHNGLAQEPLFRVFSIGQFGAGDYIVLEYIEGGTLEDYLSTQYQGRQIPLERALELLRQIAKGLAAVHRAGIVHRDIKPANLMFQGPEDELILMDFGLGTRLSDSIHQTSGNFITGTPAYMAPEVIMEGELSKAPGVPSDIYSFGASAFEIITGRLPFTTGSWIQLLTAHIEKPVPRPSDFREDLPSSVDDLIMSCLAKNPKDRPYSATQLLDNLAIIRSELVPQTPSSFWDTGRRSGASSSEQARRNAAIVVEERREVGTDSRNTVRTSRSGALQQSSDFFDSVENHIEPQIVLVSSSDGELLGTLRGVLDTQNSWKMISAFSNDSALGLLNCASPKLFIADLNDAGINGLELTASLASMGWTGSLVLVTERNSSEEQKLLLQLGVSRILELPVAPAELEVVLGLSDQEAPIALATG